MRIVVELMAAKMYGWWGINRGMYNTVEEYPRYIYIYKTREDDAFHTRRCVTN